jgi:hypothetical protein
MGRAYRAGPTSCRMAMPALSTSESLAQNKTKSSGRTITGSSGWRNALNPKVQKAWLKRRVHSRMRRAPHSVHLRKTSIPAVVRNQVSFVFVGSASLLSNQPKPDQPIDFSIESARSGGLTVAITVPMVSPRLCQGNHNVSLQRRKLKATRHTVLWRLTVRDGPAPRRSAAKQLEYTDLWKQPITLSNSMRATFYLIDLVSQCTAVRACRQNYWTSSSSLELFPKMTLAENSSPTAMFCGFSSDWFP